MRITVEELLNILGVKIIIEFARFDYFFIEDNERRDIYDVTIKRGSKNYKFEFGQSIRYSGTFALYDNAGKLVKVTRDSSEIVCSLWERKRPKAPNAQDIIVSLTKYNPGTFEDFCQSYGYDTDSITAKKIYDRVVQEWLAVSDIFSEAELEKLREID